VLQLWYATRWWGPDDQVLGPRYFDGIGHLGRVVRVLLAWFLTAIGLVYSGWGIGLMFLGPAAVLLAFAGAHTKRWGVVALFSLPTAIGVCVTIYGLLRMARGLFPTLGVSVASTLLAVLLGGPRPRS